MLCIIIYFYYNKGRILNRFSKDMGAIDEMLPAASLDCIQVIYLNIYK